MTRVDRAGLCGAGEERSGGGSNDCKRHIETESHKIKSKPTNVKKLTSYFDQPVSTKVKEQDTKTRKAELIMCSFIVKHNLPFAAMDSLSEAVRQSFPDSGIASGFKCGRTKTTSLIKEMSCQEIERLAGLMKANPFSIATDGSNDMVGGRKYYPLVVRVCTPNGVDGGLLALRNCEGQSTGCIIHLVHIAAKKGSAELRSIEEALVDIYYYFKKSANRQNNFKRLQVMFDLEQKKCLKHVSTRWLSIQNGVERLLLNWVALKEFFLEESRNQKTDLAKGKAKAIFEFLKSPTNHLHSTFLLYATKLFNPLLVGLQAEEPLIHTVRHEMEVLLQQLMTKYIKPSFLVGKKPTELQHKKADLQKEDKDLGIGVEALMLLANAEENHLRQSRLPDFYRAVRKFYQTAVDYLLKSLPWEDPFLKSVAVVDITQRMTASNLDLLTLLKRFPCLMTAGYTIDDHVSMLDLLKATELGDLSGPLCVA
ncbi:hypothetical protein EGW08_004196 [Elysia chlorotica]|uniref:DUF4371 domain-containing protein n=1 Tax=Elysia chlorotica TaxID=188477 RepID=A0A433U2K2_ELYCH|nr:hypothetical protein EGW08_004196 [Elysia chlorotica]